MSRRHDYEYGMAPCGCPLAPPSAPTTGTTYSQYSNINCPFLQTGSFRQHGTDLQQAPLIVQHLHYCQAQQYQTPQASMSWQSRSTQMEDANYDEGYNRLNRGTFEEAFPLALTPEAGTNMNEPQLLERAAMHGRARRISEPLGRFVQGEQQDDVEVDENGNAFYVRRPWTIPVAPAYYSPQTGPLTGTLAAYQGNPSSRGGGSSERSGRRNSREQSSSDRGNNNLYAGMGAEFDGQEDEIETELSISGYIEGGMFQYEQ